MMTQMNQKLPMKTNDDFLCHHGTKGQKWGVRRYQEKDGSLTPLGRIHWGIGPERKAAIKKKFTLAKDNVKKLALKAKTKHEENLKLRKEKQEQSIANKKAKLISKGDPAEIHKNRALFSDAELDQAMNRIKKLQDLKSMDPKQREAMQKLQQTQQNRQVVKDGRSMTDKLLSAGKTAVSLAGTAVAVYQAYNKIAGAINEISGKEQLPTYDLNPWSKKDTDKKNNDKDNSGSQNQGEPKKPKDGSGNQNQSNQNKSNTASGNQNQGGQTKPKDGSGNQNQGEPINPATGNYNFKGITWQKGKIKGSVSDNGVISDPIEFGKKDIQFGRRNIWNEPSSFSNTMDWAVKKQRQEHGEQVPYTNLISDVFDTIDDLGGVTTSKLYGSPLSTTIAPKISARARSIQQNTSHAVYNASTAAIGTLKGLYEVGKQMTVGDGTTNWTTTPVNDLGTWSSARGYFDSTSSTTFSTSTMQQDPSGMRIYK